MKIKMVNAMAVVAAGSALPFDRVLRESQGGFVYVCTGFYWTAQCDNIPFASDSCKTLPSIYLRSIKSWGPDRGWFCNMWTEPDCSGNPEGNTYPGDKHLTEGLSDIFQSFNCTRL
ncbi:hypothetical protein B0H13DRAFT_1950929 [Mycena leptocephala]|nr:hypothetical protein B0H13DRAFT_1950929 [Mycena leptocephala]